MISMSLPPGHISIFKEDDMAIYHYGLTSELSRTEFIRRKRFLERLIAKLEARLEKAPEGSLVVSRNPRVSFCGFYHVVAGRPERVYLNQSHRKDICRLAQKEYDRKTLRIAKKELEAIDGVIAYCDTDKVEDAIASCHVEKQRYITPVVESDDDYRRRWLAQPYVQKKKKEDDLLFPTEKGDLVQSKSESMQADHLFLHDYAYLYEKRIELYDRGRLTYRYPDFTILDPVTRKEVIFEHFGMVDQDEYFRNSFIDKLRLYLENGYVIGDNLLFTFETQEHPFTIDQFIKVLESRFGKSK